MHQKKRKRALEANCQEVASMLKAAMRSDNVDDTFRKRICDKAVDAYIQYYHVEHSVARGETTRPRRNTKGGEKGSRDESRQAPLFFGTDEMEDTADLERAPRSRARKLNKKGKRKSPQKESAVPIAYSAFSTKLLHAHPIYSSVAAKEHVFPVTNSPQIRVNKSSTTASKEVNGKPRHSESRSEANSYVKSSQEAFKAKEHANAISSIPKELETLLSVGSYSSPVRGASETEKKTMRYVQSAHSRQSKVKVKSARSQGNITTNDLKPKAHKHRKSAQEPNTKIRKKRKSPRSLLAKKPKGGTRVSKADVAPLLTHKEDPKPHAAEAPSSKLTVKNGTITLRTSLELEVPGSSQLDLRRVSLEKTTSQVGAGSFGRETRSDAVAGALSGFQPAHSLVAVQLASPSEVLLHSHSITSEAGAVHKGAPQETQEDELNHERAVSPTSATPASHESNMFLSFVIPPPRGALFIPPQTARMTHASDVSPLRMTPARTANDLTTVPGNEIQQSNASPGTSEDLPRPEEIAQGDERTRPSGALLEIPEYSPLPSSPCMPHAPPSTPEAASGALEAEENLGNMSTGIIQHQRNTNIFSRLPRPNFVWECCPKRWYGTAIATALLTIRVPSRRDGPISRISRRRRGSRRDRTTRPSIN